MMDKKVTVYADVVGKVTEKAFSLGFDTPSGLVFQWFPKSQCQAFKNKVDGSIKVEMPYWMFKQKGLDCTGWNGTPYYQYTIH